MTTWQSRPLKIMLLAGESPMLLHSIPARLLGICIGYRQINRSLKVINVQHFLEKIHE